MTTPTTSLLPDWLSPVAATLDRHDRAGGFLVVLPAYRPDLSRVMASALDLQFVDFRAEVMARAGTQAARLPLDELDAAARSPGDAPGIVLHNAEALLACKPADARAAWFSALQERGCGPARIVPVTIFAHELPVRAPRLVRLEPNDLPAESLLMRLATS